MILAIIILIDGSYFLADTVLEELTFGWSPRMEDLLSTQQLTNEVTSRSICDNFDIILGFYNFESWYN